MEFFSRGLELGNQVYMQYQVMPDGSHEELKTKVIDMGAGLERWSWFSHGAPMSYDTTFPKVMEYLYAQTGVKPDAGIWGKFARYAGLLSFDEIEDAGAVWQSVAKEVGIDVRELKREVYRMRALYAIGEHARTLLVGIHDGALPSNVGGGYNLRNILRRCWTLMDEYGFSFELEKVFEKHIDEFGRWYTELREVGSLWDILKVERERFEEGGRKTKAIVERMIAEEEEFTAEKLAQLYDSQGIHPNMISEFKKDLVVPDNFYKLVEERHEKSAAAEKAEAAESAEKKLLIELARNTSGPTELLYYDNLLETEFEAKVLKTFADEAGGGKGSIILDRTLFYPEGGGQESDKGTITAGEKKLEVYEVVNHKGVVEHKVTSFDGFWLNKTEGSAVECEIDAGRRLQLMQHHTGTHVINAAANRVLGPHVWQAGAHKSESIARLDVTHYKAVSAEELGKIEEDANRIIAAGIEVKKMVLPRDEAEKRYGFRIYQGGAVPGTELRIIEILGVDAEACGGTHLDNTREIEKIKVVKASRIQDGVVRIEFKAGAAAGEESTREEEIFSQAVESLPVELKDQSFGKKILEEAASAVGVQSEMLPQTIKRFVDEWQETGVPLKIEDSNLSAATKSLFEGWKSARKRQESAASDAAGKIAVEIEAEFEKNKVVKKITEGLSVPALMKAANDAVTKDGRTLVLLNIAGDKCNIVVSSSNKKTNAGKIAEELSKKLGGGGRGTQNLGVGGGKAKDVRTALSEIRI
jgi:alanine--tRNA ligase